MYGENGEGTGYKGGKGGGRFFSVPKMNIICIIFYLFIYVDGHAWSNNKYDGYIRT